MDAIDTAALKEQLARTVGPTPWYWNTFPAVVTTSGQRLVWKHHGDQGALAYVVSLAPEDVPDKPVLALNTYCRPFMVPPDRLGIWCPEGSNLRFVCFDPLAMKSFDFAEIAGWFKQSSERIYAATEPICDFEVSAALQPGMHKIEVPEPLQTVEELIAPTSYPSKEANDPDMALLVFYFHAGLVEVLPQKWFTRGKRDGYEWITRVARDPKSHRIFGDGMRIRSFLLQEDGMRVERWLSEQLS